jgi:hypothetical protein
VRTKATEAAGVPGVDEEGKQKVLTRPSDEMLGLETQIRPDDLLIGMTVLMLEARGRGGW